jgi:subtilisin family serine protease
MAEIPGAPAWARSSALLRIKDSTTLEDLSPEWAWGGSSGAGVRVAILDSGVECDHPALHGTVDHDGGVEIVVEKDGSVREIEGAHEDDFGHGTACAGIVHAIAPQATITSVKVIGQRSGTAACFLRGLAWAAQRDFDVINVSLGTSRRDWALPFYEICDAAYFRGCFVTTAANNVQRTSFPSLYASVTSVACNLSSDPFRFHFNPEPPTEFLARGIDLEVPWRNGSMIRSTGNSFAAPHIAGIAALILSKHPGLRPFQLKTILWATAANVLEAHDAPARMSRVTRFQSMSLRASAALAVPTPGR